MHDIEPYYHWRHLYTAEADPRSIFFGRTYSEFEFSQTVYNYYIIELIGEWNDTIENDIMELKREVFDKLMAEDIIKFILIAENVFNFHSGDKDYYEEFYEELSDEDGWAVLVNFHPAAQHDFLLRKLNRYIELMEISAWRTYKPDHFFQFIDQKLSQRLSL